MDVLRPTSTYGSGSGEILRSSRLDNSIRSILGLLDDKKRIYRYHETADEQINQQREEFSYCQVIDRMVFGKGGLVETLGPTWNLIHDPRFALIESAFIVDRRAIFGGDAKQGKQYISSEGTFTSTIADLEQYSEILGEGRHFYNVVSHDPACPVRQWLERIHTTTTVEASAYLSDCVCSPTIHPSTLKDQPDEVLWNLIKQECPNYWTKSGQPNLLARRLFDLFKADLVGLIHDYAITPLIDDWVELETGDVSQDNMNEENPRVFAEIDILEKALTYRATLRATAAKILRSIDFQKYLRGKDIKLTDIERDNLLRIIYQSNWPDDKAGLLLEITHYVDSLNLTPYEERLQVQLIDSSKQSHETTRKLVTGEILPINQYNEPILEVQMDDTAKQVESIMKNPLKMQLFLIMTDAEKLGEQAVVDILTPVFDDPDYPLTEESTAALLDKIAATGYYDEGISGFKEEFHSPESPERGWEQPVSIEELNKPMVAHADECSSLQYDPETKHCKSACYCETEKFHACDCTHCCDCGFIAKEDGNK
jgi:hypothetical protein